MKLCQQCQYKLPNKETACPACGGMLEEIPSPPGMSADGTMLACCPTIHCSRRAGAPGAKFCDLCATPLVPVSFELWLEKDVEPALAKNFIGVLQGSPDLLASAFDLGLPEDEARTFFNQAFAEKTGASQEVLSRWLKESVIPLRKAGVIKTAALREAFAHAERLSIVRPYARMIVEHFVPKLESASDVDWFDPEIDDVEALKEDTASAQQKKPDNKTTAPVVVIARDAARAAYLSLLKGMSNDWPYPLYVDIHNLSSSMFLLEFDVYLTEVSHSQSAFVLFTIDGEKGRVYPNPILRFRPSALSPLFPELTEEEFERNKENIQPCSAEKVADGRWRIVSNENGFEAGGATTAEVVNRSVARKPVEEPLDDANERTIVRPRPPQPNPLTDAQEITPVEIPVKRLSRIGLALLAIFVVLLGVVLIASWLSRPEHLSSNTNDNVQLAASNNSNAQAVAPVNRIAQPLPSASVAEVTSDGESLDSNSNVDNANAEDLEAERALLTISVTLDDVSLSVDSNPLPALSRSSSASLNLSPGRHFIRASKPGYKAWENTIYLNPQARVALPIKLEALQADAPAPPSGPSPQQQAEAHRSNAEQFLNNGNLERARLEVEQGLSLTPDNPSLQSMRSRIVAAEQILNRQNRLPTVNTTTVSKDVLPSSRELKVVGKPSTVCPDNVKAAHKCDTVFVEVQVNEQGIVYSTRIISGPKELHTLALAAAQQSRFQPALRNGQPVPSQTKLAFMFNPR